MNIWRRRSISTSSRKKPVDLLPDPRGALLDVPDEERPELGKPGPQEGEQGDHFFDETERIVDDEPFDLGGRLVHDFPDRGPEHLFLARKRLVEGRLADAELGGDIVGRDPGEAPMEEHGPGDGDDTAAGRVVLSGVRVRFRYQYFGNSFSFHSFDYNPGWAFVKRLVV
jgi:hypothetical protein